MRDFNFFDTFVQKTRVRQIINFIPQDSVVLDVGCGLYPALLMSIRGIIKEGIGIDKDPPTENIENISFRKCDISTNIDVESDFADVVVMLAVLEHMNYPQKVVDECLRVLKPGGILIIAVPSYYSRPVLEILAGIGLSSKEEVYDHKFYFKRLELQKLVEKDDIQVLKSVYYNLYMNIMLVCQKQINLP